LFPQQAVLKGRKGRVEKVPFVAPIKEMLGAKDNLLQLVQMSMEEMMALSRLVVEKESVIPPTTHGSRKSNKS
jgi:hypothetical protein